MTVPFLDLKSINQSYKKDLMAQLESVIDSGWFIMGKQLELFEKEYALYNKTNFSVGVGNGLEAIILALKVLGVGPGDEVIVPSNTYIATWLAVSYVGATVVPVEPKLSTYNIDPLLIEEKISAKTKAIIPVNLYGQAAELNKIMTLANKHNVFVIEDNAQAQGALCNGQLTGSFGQINATSFYPGKNLGALGDAGAITTNDETLAHKTKVIRNYGSQQKYYNEIKGVNSRLDELQAAFLLTKLKHLNSENDQRVKIAAIYNEQLKGLGDLVLPVLAEGCTSNYHLYVVRTEKRNELQKFLSDKGIGTVIHYPVPPHMQQAYSEYKFNIDAFPLAGLIANTCLSLPIYPGMKMDQISYICETISKFYA